MVVEINAPTSSGSQCDDAVSSLAQSIVYLNESKVILALF